ncbi:MAG: UDP-N-acetylmuramoyl-L-alanyl-D-glutamate--2,6-diaminopimelate ligase [Elusimicrobia bacterium]|nr:UDP-N-acetylmuramoyl-L-alanyl-D-glutamate--2,6-diaminopimelate ligase [Elusimicrobiota bacterium]
MKGDRTLGDLMRRFRGRLKAVTGVAESAAVTGVASDSRRAAPGVVFCALSGQKTHGLRFAHDVVGAGCRVILMEPPWPRAMTGALKASAKKNGVSLFTAVKLRLWLGELANWVYRDPSSRLNVVAVTATSGKTTTCYFLEAIAQAAGQKVGVLGTVNYRVDGRPAPASLTTPQPDEAIGLMAQMADAGCRFCFMEATSQALDMGRLDAIRFKGAVFGNLSRDHLDYHKTMGRYFQAKARLFTDLLRRSDQTGRFAAINADDEWGRKLIKRLGSTRGLKKYSFGRAVDADVGAERIELTLDATRFHLRLGRIVKPVALKLVGAHNVANALASASAAWALGFSIRQIVDGLQSLSVVPGRLERITEAKEFLLLVDYAHKPDALENVLTTLRAIRSLKRLIVVFGCGGDRDAGKRPLMGEIATRLADFAVLTSDNPRTEDPEKIIDAIEEGAKTQGRANYRRLVDRAEAIRWAIREAKPGDCVIVAGKGHETYQIFKDRTVHFDDREVCRDILKSL